MKIQEMQLDALHPYENNPRNNSEAVEKVAASIKEFGFLVPIVIDSNGVIAAGHTRYEAAKLLGLEKVPCVISEELSEEQVRAFRLADNKVAEIASWDFVKLNKELSELSDQFNFSDFGFNQFSQDFSTEMDGEESEEESDEEDGNYRIVYEIAFNDETEQAEWYSFISAIKKKFPDMETISERIICAIRQWMKED